MSHDLSEEGWSPQGPVVELSDQASWDLLAGKNFGHLAVTGHDRPDIYPVNYYSDGRTVLFRTGSGSKLHKLTVNEHVAFEVDAQTPSEVWSVVVQGLAVVLDADPELSATAIGTFPPWVPTQSFIYVSITPDSIRGRMFEHHLPIGIN